MKKLKEDFVASGGKFEEWRIDRIFHIKTPIKKFNANTVVFGSKHPYVVRTSQNNGVRAYLDENEKYLNEANTISFGQDTATMFYQEKPYFSGDKIKVMKFKYGDLTSLVACYLLASMGRSFSLFSWGASSFNEKVLNSVLVKVPTKASSLAYDYMEQYISLLEEEKMLQVDKFLKDSGLNDTTLTAEETAELEKFRNGKVKFKEWKIGELFEPLNLKFKKKKFNKNADVSKEKNTEFSLPLVNAKNGDNGIMYYGRECDFESAELSIDIVNDGAISTGNVYAQPQKTGVLYNAYLVKLKNYNPSAEILLYYAPTMQKSIKLRFGYEKKANWERVKKENISVPVTIDGEIDNDFMHHFISAQEKLAIKGVVKYKNEALKARPKTSYDTRLDANECLNQSPFPLAAEPAPEYSAARKGMSTTSQSPLTVIYAQPYESFGHNYGIKLTYDFGTDKLEYKITEHGMFPSSAQLTPQAIDTIKNYLKDSNNINDFFKNAHSTPDRVMSHVTHHSLTMKQGGREKTVTNGEEQPWDEFWSKLCWEQNSFIEK